jgi:hypothetical protein
MAGFQNVLKRLVEDGEYRELVAKDVYQLKRDHELDAEELAVLIQVWVNSSEAARLSIWNLCHCCCCGTK